MIEAMPVANARTRSGPRPVADPLPDQPLAVAAPEPRRPAPVPDHRLSVVVPMFDEVDNAVPMLSAVEAALAEYAHPWELVVVDDGSRDGTGAVLQQEAARIGSHVRVIRLLRNHGQSAAMQAGIDAARGDVIVTLDGDLQNDPRDIPGLVRRLLLGDLDLVAGWRRGRRDGMLLRRVPSWLANQLIQRVTGLRFRDLGCSLKAYRASVLHAVRLRGEMHRFVPAWLATVTAAERMTEEPVAHHPRIRGRSKYGLSRTFRVLLDLLAVRFILGYRSRPGHFFGGIGLGLLAAGASLLAWTAAGAPGGAHPSLQAVTTALLVIGAQLVATGLLAELLIRSGGGDPHPPAPLDRAPRDADWHHAPR